MAAPFALSNKKINLPPGVVVSISPVISPQLEQNFLTVCFCGKLIGVQVIYCFCKRKIREVACFPKSKLGSSRS
jgi:hypothetical protein